MPLLEQTVLVPLASGVDTKTDVKLLPMSGKLAVLENAVLQTALRAQKRNGYIQLSSNILGGATSIAAGDGLAAFKNEVLEFNGPNLYSRSTGSSGWASKGVLSAVQISGKQIMGGTTQQTIPDSATSQGVTIYAWEDSSTGGTRASVMDDVTGTVLAANISINASGLAPKCVGFPSALMVVYRVAGAIKCKIWNIQTAAFGTEVTITSDIQNTNPSPMDVIPAQTQAIIAYGTGAAVKVAWFKPTGALEGAGDPFPAAITIGANPINSIAIVYDPSTSLLYCAYDTTVPALKGFVLNGDFTTKVADKNLDATATIVNNVTGVMDPTTANQCDFFYEFNNATSWKVLTQSLTFNSAGTVGSPAIFKRGVGLASKAWAYGGNTYIGCVYQTLLNPTYFVLDGSGNAAARMLPTLAGGLTAKKSSLAQVRLSGSVVKFVGTKALRLNTATSTISYVTGVWEAQLDFAGTSKNLSVTLGDNLHIVGGVLYGYDGYAPTELGFHYPPENVTAAVNGVGLTGTYQYAVVYEWADAQGQIHQSAPSVAVSIALTNQGVRLTIPTLRLSAKTNVSIVVYRTAANLTTFYRITSLTSPTANDATVDSITYDDTAADSTIIANQTIYTSGSPAVLQNDAPPPCNLIAVGKNRIVVAHAEQPNTLWYSKAYAPGNGVAFSGNLIVQMPVQAVGTGAITAVSIMDDKVIIFKRSTIFAYAGDAPDPTGSNNFLQAPQIISTDVGCSQPLSIVTTPEGLMFKSTKGIYLLTRGLVVQYIGAEVEAFNAQTVKAATLLENANQVRFVCSDGAALVYDYYYKQWSTFANHAGNGAALVNGMFYYLRTTGMVWQETPGIFSDNGTYIPFRLRTGWIHIGGPMGYQRVWKIAVLGDYKTAHYLQAMVAYDYETFFTDQIQWNPAAAANSTTWGSDALFGNSSPFGGYGDNVELFIGEMPRQRCTAVQFEISDQAQGGTLGEGCNLSALALLCGSDQKQRFARQRPERRA